MYIMCICKLPIELQDMIIDNLQMDSFYLFCSVNKEYNKRLSDEKYWKKFLHFLSTTIDPYNLFFKKNYKTNKIRLFFNDTKLTIAMYYSKYLFDKYRISSDKNHEYNLMKRQSDMLNIHDYTSDIDKDEKKLLIKRIELYERRIRKYNELQYKFNHSYVIYSEKVQNRYQEIFDKDETRLMKLIDFLCDDNIFHYKYGEQIDYSDLKNRFKKYNKRFSKITPVIYSSQFKKVNWQNYKIKLNKLSNSRIMSLYTWMGAGWNAEFYVFHGFLHTKFKFNNNDKINNIKFKE